MTRSPIRRARASASLALLCFASSAGAQSLYSAAFSGTTIGRPSFLRLTCAPETPTNPATQCVTPRTGVTRWESHTFDVSVNTGYTLVANWVGFDGFLLLYRGVFDPTSPRTGLIATNDDGTDRSTSVIRIGLSPGTYTLVATGYAETDAGSYTGSIGGVETLIRVVTASPLVAQYTGATSEGTFQRPTCRFSNPLDGCSLADGAYPYSTRALITGNTGPHEVRSVQRDGDGVALVYAGAFDPAHPLRNLVGYSDDDYSSSSSAVDILLTANKQPPPGVTRSLGYYVVVTTTKAPSSRSDAPLSFSNEFRPVQRSDNREVVIAGLASTAIDGGLLDGSSATFPRVSCLETYPTIPARTCALGDVRPYNAVTFTAAGFFSIHSAQQFDGSLLLYTDSFDPSAPQAHLIAQNNDGSGGVGTSNVAYDAGRTPTRFVAVTQGWSTTAAGSYATQGFSSTGEFSFSPYVPVASDDPAEGQRLTLAPPAPNPAGRSTTLRLEVPDAGPVRLAVVDALGRVVAVVADGPLYAGEHAWTLDTSRFAAGVYVVQVQTGTGAASRRLVVQ